MKGSEVALVAGGFLTCMFVNSNAQGAVILSEPFEYADQAAFDSVWPISGTNTTATLSTTQAFSPTHSVSAGTAAQRAGHVIPETTHSLAAPITFSFRFYDSNAAAGAYREYAELVDGTGAGNSQLIAMGLNNNIVSSNYMARIVGSDGGQGLAAFFKLDGTGVPTRSTGWHSLKTVIDPNGISFYVDDVFSKTVAHGAGGTARSYDLVRIGSNLTSTTQAFFDDVLVSTDPVPEPGVFAPLAFLGLGLARRRHRRASF
jgi:hypothetical protein